MNLLVIEDETTIREGICEFFQEDGYQVFSAADGLTGLEQFAAHTVHLVILDIMLPKRNGLQVLAELRKSSSVPVIMLTAMGEEQTQIQSFDALADDFLSKPFSLIILKKRVEALLRRHYANRTIWRYGQAAVDFSSFQATYNGQDAEMKPKEIQLLSVLLDHAGQVLSREQILDLIWKDSEAPYDRIVDVYIKNIRKKLHLDCIITVKNVGYKLELQP